jgi:hypothetical protein
VRNGLILMIFLGLAATSAYASDDPLTRLFSANNLLCHFAQQTATSWAGNKTKTLPANSRPDVHFNGIDIRYQSAHAISIAGAHDVKVLPARVGLSFLELSPTVVDLTTVFALYGQAHDFIAVETRHAIVHGMSTTEQYYGSCAIVQ